MSLGCVSVRHICTKTFIFYMTQINFRIMKALNVIRWTMVKIFMKMTEFILFVTEICQLQNEDIFISNDQMQFSIWEWLAMSRSPCGLELISEWCSVMLNTAISVTEYLIFRPRGNKYKREAVGSDWKLKGMRFFNATGKWKQNQHNGKAWNKFVSQKEESVKLNYKKYSTSLKLITLCQSSQ